VEMTQMFHQLEV
jgi:hypothetical protein